MPQGIKVFDAKMSAQKGAEKRKIGKGATSNDYVIDIDKQGCEISSNNTSKEIVNSLELLETKTNQRLREFIILLS